MVVVIYITKVVNTKPLHGIQTGSPLVVTLGQQYNVGEKPTAILYTYINHHAQPPIIPQHNHSCYITSRIRWVFKKKIRTDVPGLWGKKNKKKRLGGIKDSKVFKEKSERYITSRNGWVSLKGIFRWYICSLLYYI